MKQVGYTPGPWRVGKNGGVVADTKIKGGPGGSDDVDYYGGHLVCESVTQANAALIATAPELLRALSLIANSCELVITARSFPSKLRPGMQEIVRITRAAIAKAEGHHE